MTKVEMQKCVGLMISKKLRKKTNDAFMFCFNIVLREVVKGLNTANILCVLEKGFNVLAFF